jgi:hypothetical protein
MRATGVWEGGRYRVYAAASCADVRQSWPILVEGNIAHERTDFRMSAPSYYDLSRLGQISDEEFAVLLGGRSLRRAAEKAV